MHWSCFICSRHQTALLLLASWPPTICSISMTRLLPLLNRCRDTEENTRGMQFRFYSHGSTSKLRQQWNPLAALLTIRMSKNEIEGGKKTLSASTQAKVTCARQRNAYHFVCSYSYSEASRFTLIEKKIDMQKIAWLYHHMIVNVRCASILVISAF